MNIAAFNGIDYIILGLIAFSLLISFIRGFVREAISLATWVIAAWLAYKYGHDFAEHFLKTIEAEQIRLLVAYAILFFGTLIIGALVNFTINRFVYITGLSAIDRILGMAFGFARGVLLIAVFVLVGQAMQAEKKAWWTESQLIPYFSGIGEWLKSFVPEQFDRLKQVEHTKTPAGETKGQEQESVLGTVLPQATDIAKQGVVEMLNQATSAAKPKPTTSTAPPLPQ